MVKNERHGRGSITFPTGLAEEAILANVFPKGHPYSWSVIGSMKDLDAASLQDLRQVSSPSSTTQATPRSAWRATSTRRHAKGVDPPSYFEPIPAGKPIKAGGRPDTAPGRQGGHPASASTRSASPGSTWAWPTVADDPIPMPLALLPARLGPERRRSLATPNRALVKDVARGQRRRRRQRRQRSLGPLHHRRDRRSRARRSRISRRPMVNFAVASGISRPARRPRPELTRALAHVRAERPIHLADFPARSRHRCWPRTTSRKMIRLYYLRDYARYYKVTHRRPRAGRRDLSPEAGKARARDQALPTGPDEQEECGAPWPDLCPARLRRASNAPEPSKIPEDPIWKETAGADSQAPRLAGRPRYRPEDALQRPAKSGSIPWKTLAYRRGASPDHPRRFRR